MANLHIAWYRVRGILLTVLCSLVFFLGSYVANQPTVSVSSTAEGRELPVHCVQTENPVVSLTFDCVWSRENTRIILDILGKYNAKATFFVTGTWVDLYPEYVKQIAEAGHDLGNYSQSYKNMSGMRKAEIQQEIQSVHERVRELTGLEMKLFRAPYNDYSSELIGTVKMSGYMPICRNVDSEDWKNYGIDSIIQKVTNNDQLGNGSIVLMHNGADYTAQALETVITSLQEQGYELVPVSQLVAWDHYYIDARGRQIQE